MIQAKPEERIHIGTGLSAPLVEYKGQTLTCLTRKRDRVLLWTADVGAGRAAELEVNHKGDFLAWVAATDVKFA